MAHQVPPELEAAARIHAVRQQVLSAVGRLAAQPLNVAAADQMRAALARVESPEVRAALREVMGSGGRRPTLRVLDGGDTSGGARTLRSMLDASIRRPVIAGGVA